MADIDTRADAAAKKPLNSFDAYGMGAAARKNEDDLILEVNALEDHFCIAFQVFNKDERPFQLFCQVLDEEGIPHTETAMLTRYMPKIQLP